MQETFCFDLYLIQRQTICGAKTGLLLETIFIYWIDCVSIY